MLAAEKRIGTDGFHSNLHQGGIAENVLVTEQMQKIASDITEITGLDIIGIDLLQAALI